MNLRPDQSAACDAIFKEWQENDSTLVVMPMGGGKTIRFAASRCMSRCGMPRYV
jgi:superfamily II DNA or RNA helicase